MKRDHGHKIFGLYDVRDDRRRDDENFEHLLDNWADYGDSVVLFLGAGASPGARGGTTDETILPTALTLRNELWQKMMVGTDAFDGSKLGMMSLEHATALIESRKARQALVRAMQDKFVTRKPLWTHVVLPFLKPTALFTTNYDQLIELGWDQCRARTRDVPQLVPIFAENQAWPRNAVPLFKPHGSVERGGDRLGHGGIVVTLFDYFELITSKQRMLEEWLRRFHATCAIFVGYSFMDMDLASHLFAMRREHREVPWYAVFPRDDADVRRMYADKFGILQIDRTFFEFVSELDVRLNFIPDSWKVSRLAELQANGVVQ